MHFFTCVNVIIEGLHHDPPKTANIACHFDCEETLVEHFLEHIRAIPNSEFFHVLHESKMNKAQRSEISILPLMDFVWFIWKQHTCDNELSLAFEITVICRLPKSLFYAITI